MRTVAKLVFVGGVLIVGILVLLNQRSGMDPGTGNRRPKTSEFDLQMPDALIVTQSLAQLPKDILTVPLLKELLTEDFFFYYEQNEGGLSLRGTLRRMVYEHELNIGDQLIDYIFNAPAKLAFWKGRDGKLGRFMLVVDRSAIVHALELASKVVLSDKQLMLKGELQSPADGALAVYELKYAYNRSLFFTSLGGYFVAFSDAGMLLTEDDSRKASVTAFLEARDPSGAFLQRFDLEQVSGRHAVAVAVSFLSFGYQRFFPAMEALRFEYDGSVWTASVSLNEKLPEAIDLWRAVPAGAALCVALPVAPDTLIGVLGKMASSDESRALIGAVESPAAVCWYTESRLYSPLVLVRMKENSQTDRLIKAIFEKSIGAHEAGIPAPKAAQEDQGSDRPQGEQATTKKSYFPPFEVRETKTPQGAIWRREVSSIYGKYESTSSPNADKMWSTSYFAVTLARWKNVLLFSPDDALVENALAALNKKYPAVSDLLPAGSDLSLIVFPENLGRLAKDEVLDSLPDQQEPVFRASVSRSLLPVLDKLKSYPAYGLSKPQGSHGWETLRWQPLAVH
jgi:uncharacterized protein YfaA (DUF2138 family)